MKSILLAAAAFIFSPVAHAADIFVLAGGATRDVIEELIPAFEKATGHKVLPTWDAAPAIRKRLEAGGTFDLVISSAPEIDAFILQGKLVPGSRTGLMQTGVGVAVKAGAPKPDISSPDALKRALLAARTIGHSAGTSGAYVVAMMGRLGIAEETKPKLRQTPPGVRVAAMLAKDEVEIGLQQESELKNEPGISYLGPLPPELQQVTLYAAGLGTTTKQPDAAQALVKALHSPAAAAVIAKHGMQPG
jgi:molybdate transport system substrate-binding protein